MIEFLNPDADVGIEDTPYDLSVKVDGGNATTIGLLANGFPDSVPFLDEVGKAIGRLRPGINLKAYNKGNATIAAPEKLLGEIGGDCVGAVPPQWMWCDASRSKQSWTSADVSARAKFSFM